LYYSNARLERPWYRENDTERRNAAARSMYESLMTVTLRRSTSPEYKLFSQVVKKLAYQEYGEDVYGDGEVSSNK